jgi:hypothetical protein
VIANVYVCALKGCPNGIRKRRVEVLCSGALDDSERCRSGPSVGSEAS